MRAGKIPPVNSLGKLHAPRLAKVHRLAQSKRHGNFAESLVTHRLLFEDFIDVDGGKLTHLAQDLAYQGSSHRCLRYGVTYCRGCVNFTSGRSLCLSLIAPPASR